MYLRIVLWTIVMAYAGYLMTGGKNLSSPSMMITTAFLGALLGFLMAMMFTLRKRRRESRAGRYLRSGLQSDGGPPQMHIQPGKPT